MGRAIPFDRLRLGAAFLIGLTIPLSVTISEIVTVAALILVLAERPPREAWRAIGRNPVVWTSLALFLLLTLALAYTAAPMKEALHIWQKYRELAYLPLLLLLCRDAPAARAGLAGFLSAVLVIVIINGAVRLNLYFGFAPHSHFSFFGSYITQGVLIALAAYHLAVEAILNRRWRPLAACAAAFALLYTMYIEIGRTGYMVAIVLSLLLLFQTAPRKWLPAGLLVVALLAGGVFVISPDMAGRMSGVIVAIEDPSHSTVTNMPDAASASAGARLRFYHHALVVISRHPLFGTGTGSFSKVYNDQAAIDDHASTANPHNEFLMIGVQTGIVGVALLLAFFAALWISAGRLPVADAWRGRAATLALLTSCLFNSSLLDHVDGQSFIFQIALFYFAAGTRRVQREDPRENQRHRHDL
jgi:O-antigen ligase